MSGGFSPVDVSILILYIAASMYVGLRHARRQHSLEGYFLAERSVPWWAAGISVIASDTSAISYMGAPAYIFKNDLQLAVGFVCTFPLMMLVVAYLFVPFMARLRLYTIYEYLEKRFGVTARVIASGLFLVLRGGHLAVAIYAQALALTLITGMPTAAAVWICGTVVTLYTVFGGMKAVIWTDVMQFFVTLGGIIAVLIAILLSVGGDVGTIWRLSAENDNTRLATFALDPMTKVTLWALLLGNAVMFLGTYSSDQVIVQRYLATGSRRDMVRAVLLNGFLGVPPMVGLYCAGLGLTAYYALHPELRASLDHADRVLPHFIVHVLPVGVAGLVIAGMLAATMSSVSAGLNSLSTATVVDFYQRFRRRPASAKSDVRLAKGITLAWGLLVTVPALWVGRVETVVESALIVIGFFSGPLLAMFLLGVLTRRTNSFGVIVGAVVGTGITCYAATTNVSYLLYGPIGCAACMGTGYLASYLAPPPDTKAVRPLTIGKGSPESGTSSGSGIPTG
jgi:SSS family transporter